MPGIRLSLFASAWDSLMTFSSQPVSSLARRMFWPPRPMAWESLSSDTAMSMRVRILVHDDGGDFRRRHGVDDELRVVLVERNDVDALAGDFVGHRLHARTAHADARAHRIDARIVAAHRDLGAHARDRGPPPDVDETLAHFRHLELEQLDQELRGGARRNSCGPRGSERTSFRYALMRSCERTGSRGIISSRAMNPSAFAPRST